MMIKRCRGMWYSQLSTLAQVHKCGAHNSEKYKQCIMLLNGEFNYTYSDFKAKQISISFYFSPFSFNTI